MNALLPLVFTLILPPMFKKQTGYAETVIFSIALIKHILIQNNHLLIAVSIHFQQMLVDTHLISPYF